MEKIKVIAVVGPTASGKTDLAVEIAKRVDGEIISFDSMQIYKGMHIASAAPSQEEMQGIPHHLLEFLENDTNFSVADFVKLARQKALEITKRGKKVIIAGGTGLYINSFLNNVSFSEEEIDLNLREKLNTEYDTVGGETMLERLREFDPDSADRLHPNNKKRIIRAFEIYISTGKTMTYQLENSLNDESPYIPFMIGITFKDREKLYERIGKRVDLMLSAGLLDEAKLMYNKNLTSTAAAAIGHKELFSYFRGETSLDDALENLKRETRRYAKRQLTWFRRDDRISWIYRDEEPNVTEVAQQILERNGYFG